MSSYKQLSNQGPPLLSTGASKSRDKRRPISGVISTGHGPRCSTPLIHGQQWAKQQVLARFIVFSANLNFVTMFSLPASYVEMEDPSRFIGGVHSHSSNHDPPDWEDVWGAGSDKCAVASSTIRPTQQHMKMSLPVSPVAIQGWGNPMNVASNQICRWWWWWLGGLNRPIFSPIGWNPNVLLCSWNISDRSFRTRTRSAWMAAIPNTSVLID